MAARAPATTPGLAPPDPATEGAIAGDLLKRAALAAPVVVGIAALARGTDGAVSAALALTLVAANFVLAAAGLAWAARISPGAYMGTALGGYMVRLGVITVVVVAVRNATWVDLPTLAVTLAGSHLGLLTWELRSVSLSFSSPGLKPAPGLKPTRHPHGEGAAR